MNKNNIILIHIAVWTILFISPLIMMGHGMGIKWFHFIGMSGVTLAQMIVFYLNYFWITPRYFTRTKKRYYWLTNILTILLVCLLLQQWMDFTKEILDVSPPMELSKRPPAPIIRDIVNLAIAAAIATFAKLAMKFQEAENARQEAEVAKTKAELKNLRSQINPHFLLNTLNNIYSLTAINTAKAQKAIIELSKLMRHMLYDNHNTYIDIKEEIHFIENYINLMKLRLTDNVRVETHFDIPNDYKIQIAPLLFISLIENAFKHGVSLIIPSFVSISIIADRHSICCEISNSYNPKNTTDNSGHGIGLKQVSKRLELLYHNKYEWRKGPNREKTIYTSKITIYDINLRNN